MEQGFERPRRCTQCLHVWRKKRQSRRPAQQDRAPRWNHVARYAARRRRRQQERLSSGRLFEREEVRAKSPKGRALTKITALFGLRALEQPVIRLWGEKRVWKSLFSHKNG